MKEGMDDREGEERTEKEGERGGLYVIILIKTDHAVRSIIWRSTLHR